MEVSRSMQKWCSRLWPIALLMMLFAGYRFLAFDDPFALLTAALLIVCALPLYLSVRMGRLELFEPILFHSIFFSMMVFGWIERVYFREPDLRYDFISRSFEEGFLLIGILLLVLFLSILAGYYRVGPFIARRLSHVGSRVRGLASQADHLSGSAFRVIGALFLLVGLAGVAGTVVFAFPTNEILFMYSNTYPRSQVFAGNGVFVLLSRGLYVGYLFWLCGAVVEGRTPSVLEFSLVLPVMMAFLIMGGRGRAFSAVIVAVVFFYYSVLEDVFSLTEGLLSKLTDYVPPLVALLLLPFIGLAVAVAVIVLQALRLDQSLSEGIRNVDVFSILTVATHPDAYDNFLGLLEIVPSQVDYFYGGFYARVPLNYIPRAIWPEKPASTTGGFFRRIALPDATGGRPPGIMGDYYINFGMPGIPLMGFLYGVFLYLTYRLVVAQSLPSSFGRKRVPALFFVLFVLVLITVGQSGFTNNALIALLSNLLMFGAAVSLLFAWKLVSTARTGLSR